MSRLPLVVAAALLAATQPARATDAGQGCAMQVTYAVDSDLGRKTAVLTGGPWVADSTGVTIACGVTTDKTCATVGFTRTSATTPGVAAIEPFVFEFYDFGSAVYLKTTVTYGSTTHTSCAVGYWGNEG